MAFVLLDAISINECRAISVLEICKSKKRRSRIKIVNPKFTRDGSLSDN